MSLSGPTIKRGHSKQDYGTPQEFLRAVKRLLGIQYFAIDLAATKVNTCAPVWLGPDVGIDSLQAEWTELLNGGWGWLNPPFSNIAPWAAKCRAEAMKGAKIAFLVPASVGSNWYRDSVHDVAEVLFLNGRLTFVGETQPFPKDCLLALYDHETYRASHDVWKWKDWV
jgi:hypothetical protein